MTVLASIDLGNGATMKAAASDANNLNFHIEIAPPESNPHGRRIVQCSPDQARVILEMQRLKLG